MAEWSLHPHARTDAQRSHSENQESASLPYDEGRSGRGVLVLGQDGKVVNQQQRRAHAARVGYQRATKASSSIKSPVTHTVRHTGPQAQSVYRLNVLKQGRTPSITIRVKDKCKKIPTKPASPGTGGCIQVKASGNTLDAARIVSILPRQHSRLLHLPLDMYPMQIQGRARAAFKYYIEVYVPAAFRRTQYRGLTQDLSLIQDLVPFFLSNKVIFAATLARAILQNDMLITGSNIPSPQAMEAYGLALGLLRQHLFTTVDKVSDMVICAMVYLIAFDNLSNDPTRAWMHVAAVKEAITRRGGRENLGFNGWLATTSQSFVLHNESQQALVSSQRVADQTFGTLKSTVISSIPDTCLQMKKLPQAFLELCLWEHVTEPVMELLVEIRDWRDTLYTGKDERNGQLHYSGPLGSLDAKQKNAIVCSVLLQNPRLPIKDQLVVMALKAYCALLDDTDEGNLNLAQLQMHTGLLPPDLHLGMKTRDWLTWVAMMFMASSHTDALTWSLGMRILSQQRSKRTWMERLEICSKYLWEKEFSYKVMEKLYHMRHVTQVSETDWRKFSPRPS